MQRPRPQNNKPAAGEGDNLTGGTFCKKGEYGSYVCYNDGNAKNTYPFINYAERSL